MEEKIIIYCDGGSRGNPGHAASSFVVTKNSKTLFSEGRYLGIATNNVAEYTAVLMAVNWLTENQATLVTKEEVVINLDSQLVERQLNGFYKTKNGELLVLNKKIKSMISDNKLNLKFVWGYRSKNKLADELVNITLDNAISSTGKV